MRVYHFINEKFGLESIEKKRLKIARVNDLNDPFELLSYNLANPHSHYAALATKALFEKNNGILCFSTNWWNPLMWSHYADRHKGICLGFDIDDEHQKTKVIYLNNRPSIPEKRDQDFGRQFLLTKHEDWKYEEEVRLFCTLDEEDQENDLYFQSFSDDLKLKTVIIGVLSNQTKASINNLLSTYSETVEVFKASLSKHEFKITREA